MRRRGHCMAVYGRTHPELAHPELALGWLETTAIRTQVSIEQLKDVHRRIHPAERPKNEQDKPPENP